MTLDELSNNESGIITKIRGRGAFRKRITEMGFVKGKTVKVIKKAPLRDPVEYSIMGYEISLRRSEAALIEVITPNEVKEEAGGNFSGILTEEFLKKRADKKGKVINVAMVGNPNSGKTTMFNSATRSRERVGNYGGVTIDSKHGRLKMDGYTFNVYDLPGTYSLSHYSPEELFVRDHINQKMPDVVINVVDASNLERNLYLTTQLIDMDIKVVAALNMYDEMLENGDEFDHVALGKMLGIPFVPTIAKKNIGIKDLFRKVIAMYEDRESDMRHIHINYGPEIETSLGKITGKIKIRENFHLTDKISSRFLAIKLLEKDEHARNVISPLSNSGEIFETADREVTRLEKILKDDSETLITDSRYGFISGALRETFKSGKQTGRKKTELIDAFITHEIYGFPIFILFMWFMFQATFTIGEYPMHWIESLVGYTGSFLQEHMHDGTLKDLLINGIIGGVGGVIVFLPNILILFFFISLMEDTGYMARAAFIMDKIMHKIGLHGKSFIPMIMGFGCNVPAIMATRTIENRNNRLVTMLINPFMSCSARLPVYILIIGAFFPNNPGTVLFSLYLLGIIVAVLVALVAKKFFFKKEDVPFVMELPPYRVPLLKTTARHMWHKGSQYLKKMGGVILVGSIIIWALGHYPANRQTETDYEAMIAQIGKDTEERLAVNKQDSARIMIEREKRIAEIETEKLNEKHTGSYISQIGQFIEPAIRPLGFDWKMGVSLISGLVAKEIVVSTMGVLYQVNPEASLPTETLSETLRLQTRSDGSPVFTPAVAYAFLVFILLYFPCIAVIAAIKHESGSWKWGVFTIFYTTALAWMMAFLVYRVGSLIT